MNEILVPNDGWDPLFFIGFHYFDDVFHYCSLFFNYMVEHRYIDTVYIDACIYTAGLEVIMQPWWKDMDFKKKQAYCVRIPGGILTLFNPQTHLKNPGRPSVIFQYFEDVFIIFQWFSLFWRCVSLIFHYFEDGFHYFSMGFMILRSFWLLIIVNYCSLIFHYCSLIFHCFQDVAHYFHGCFIILKMCFIIFHWFFNVVACVSLIFQCFKGVLHDFSFFFLQFTCIFCIFAVPYTWKTRDGRECVKNFGVLGVSGLNK